MAAGTLAGWREAFLAGGQANLKSRSPDPEQEENARLKAIVGELALRLEIHRQAERLRAGELPFVQGRGSISASQSEREPRESVAIDGGK